LQQNSKEEQVMVKKECSNQKEVVKSKIGFKVVPAILKTGKKRKNIYTAWDGDNTLEFYSDINESGWVASYNFDTDTCIYYLSKFVSKSPNIKNYIIEIPLLNMSFPVNQKIMLDFS
jgi:hypothetical protein